ncbi:unnamed protein product [Rotaria socialis]|uniref:Uncharacterized protein n=1 Tax=Rotaria socialis TaxID=392032 RepID=A0A818FEE5_9BILA|nr:unnamed protein product [Rotaria socialis]CAF3472461.1 unnamed protein product [Rotaria socialis]CAF3509490.1 unnamed protein product [Rotaria socialis]
MNLSQETLEQYSDSHYYLNISSLNYDVNIINAPVYIAVNQINQTFIDIHHRPLYVYSGGIVFQLDTVLRLLSMNGILNTYGHHQGDLERIFVRLYIESNGKLKLHRYGYEQHGIVHFLILPLKTYIIERIRLYLCHLICVPHTIILILRI